MHPILRDAGFPVCTCGVLRAISRFAIELHRGNPHGTIAGLSGARQAWTA